MSDQRYAIGEHVVVYAPDFATATIHVMPATILTYLPAATATDAHYRVRLDHAVQVRDSGPLLDMVTPAGFILPWPEESKP